MPDSADINKATSKMDEALAHLERAVRPLFTDLAQLKEKAGETADLQKDRSQLAQKLDDALAREAELEKRQKEIVKMADETMVELDGVIAEVKQALAP